MGCATGEKKKLRIAMLGHKRIPSREGGVEIVVEELSTRMVKLGYQVTCYKRKGHHVIREMFIFDGKWLAERISWLGERYSDREIHKNGLEKKFSCRSVCIVITSL